MFVIVHTTRLFDHVANPVIGPGGLHAKAGGKTSAFRWRRRHICAHDGHSTDELSSIEESN
jgi:hypothetical protein